ncbi:MAG: glycosyltransferase family 4 protein [Gammaproteobacteria bacterium]|nr:glycosyltransferase family 4 protein [Gammaproteobacteria bacterium]
MEQAAENSQSQTSLPPGARCVFVNRYYFPYLSATSQLLTDLAIATAQAGFETVVVASRMQYADGDARSPAHEFVDRVRVFRIWTTHFGRKNLLSRALDYLSFYLSAFVALMLTVRPRDIVVAKTDPPLISIIAGVVSRIRGTRPVNWLQDFFPEVAVRLRLLSEGVLFRLTRALRNLSLRIARLNVPIGGRMAKMPCEEGIPVDSIAIISNWADGKLVAPIQHVQNPLRSAWALEHRFVVEASGNLGRAHDTATTLAAAQRLAGDPNIVFLLIGGGAGSDRLRAQAQELGLTNLQFQPYQVRARLSQSLDVPDVHLVPLLPDLEGLIVPSKVYGICAAGRPCVFIGAPDGDAAEMLAQDGFGVMVQPGDDAGLARAILELRENGERRRMQSDVARTVFEARCSRERATSWWHAPLSEIVGECRKTVGA